MTVISLRFLGGNFSDVWAAKIRIDADSHLENMRLMKGLRSNQNRNEDNIEMLEASRENKGPFDGYIDIDSPPGHQNSRDVSKSAYTSEQAVPQNRANMKLKSAYPPNICASGGIPLVCYRCRQSC